MFKPADIVAFSGIGLISDIINVATWGIPRFGVSHVGIVAGSKDGLLLWESTTLDELPCQIQGKKVSGVQCHPIDAAIERYRGRIWRYPLYRELYPEETQRLTAFLMAQIGKGYDEIGAFRSAGFGPIESMLHPENLHALFCSELVAAAYREIGIMPTDNAGKWNPHALVRSLRRREILLRPERLK
jgi:hypothetical protein